MRIIKEDEIKDLIGESTEYDKKLTLEEKDPRSWLKSVSAFANGIGGSLIYGIDDKNGEVVGIENPEKVSEKMSHFIRERMDPIPPFVLRFANVDGKALIILEIHPGTETPYYYVGKNERTAYWRTGNDTSACSTQELRELALKGSGKSYDSLSSGYKFSEMAFTKLKSVFFREQKRLFRNQIMIHLVL